MSSRRPGGVDQHVHVGYGFGEDLRLGCEPVHVDICLGRAVVVGIACRGVVTAKSPFESRSPLICVIIVAVVGVD